MPAMTFTADSGTDQLTITAHGMVTGDGPAATRNVGGALPAPLAAVTDYFVIRIDANTIKLATSSANALAGTAINLTTNGTGTNILEIGLPYRRPRTYAAGVQIKSVDLNAMSDSHVALYGLLTGQAQSLWTLVTLAISMVINGALTVTGQLSVGGQITASAGIAAFTANGLITAAVGLTASVNQHITVSGTGKLVHGTRTRSMFITLSNAIPVSGGAPTTSAGFEGIVIPSGGTVKLPVPLTDAVVETVRTIIVTERFASSSYTINVLSSLAGTFTSVPTTGGTGIGAVTASITGGKVLIAGQKLWVEILGPASGAHIVDVLCTYDSVP